MQYLVTVETKVTYIHTYTVDAPTFHNAEVEAENLTWAPIHHMKQDIGQLKFVSCDQDADTNREINTYTIDAAGWCSKCDKVPMICHTIENFDCDCACHIDEDEDEYEKMWHEACDKED